MRFPQMLKLVSGLTGWKLTDLQLVFNISLGSAYKTLNSLISHTNTEIPDIFKGISIKKSFMKALIYNLLLLSCSVLIFSFAGAQEDWPKTITAADGTIIKVYQPEPESFAGNILKYRSAI